MRRIYNTHSRRILSAVLILVLASATTGCVYLRLLKLKSQLRRFERYVRIDESNGLALLLSEPVLKEEDIVWLLEGEAAIQARGGRYSLLKYDFVKHIQDASSGNATGVPIALNLHFEDGKLYKLRFPREFSKYLQPTLLKGSLQSMGKGSVDKQNKSVSATMQTDETQIPVIPTKSEIKNILGSPSGLTETASGDMLYYQYTIQIKQKEKTEQFPTLQMWLHFSPEDEKLRVAKASFHGMTTAIAF
ncbi:MAG: hypothetical protein GY801_39880 [bacterium]|nr:hypothetical protein [bacterium]